MKKRKNSRKGLKRLIIILIILIILLIAFVVANQDDEVVTEESSQTTEELALQQTVDLTQMYQYERIYYYLNQYLSWIEEGKYETAYNHLYFEFKNTYFPTLEQYTKYVQNKYPIVITMEDNGYNSLGEYWVIDIKIIDIINSTETTEISFSQKFVLKENAINDFVISFQAE